MLETVGNKQKEVEELKRIMDQIALARFATMKRSTTQGKNVLRVMLGDKPQVPRSNGDSSKPERLFPVEKTAPPPGETKIKTLQKKPKSRKTDLTIGEKAIMKSIKKAHDHKNGEQFGFIKNKEDLGLQLTMIETYILMKFCSEGMPLVTDMSSKKGELANPKTWKDTATELTAMAKKQAKESEIAMSYCRQALSKGMSQNMEEQQTKKLASNVAKAEAAHELKKETLRQCKDFQREPDQRLAKKW